MDLGLTDNTALFNTGNFILSMQMAGMLIGGIVWGVLGDKKGRLSILFMTILLYSLANIANGFVTSVQQYAWLRFIAGFGLSGEFGLGVTLVSEVMSK
jgi:putative MFS transporter